MSHEPQGGRKQLSGPEKLAILQAYLVEKKPISDLCDEHIFQPSQIYNGRRQPFEGGAVVLTASRKPRSSQSYAVSAARLS
jgi:transposase-like protein